MKLPYRTFHLSFSLVVFLIFLVTGIYMKTGFPDLYQNDEVLRFLYRANHIYLLLVSIIHLIMGVHLRPETVKWKKLLQKSGSGLITFGTIILIAAFFLVSYFARNRYLTLMGLILILSGAALQSFPQIKSRGSDS